MPLKGEASRVYHREWMRRHRESPEVRKRENARRQSNNKTTGQSCEICGYSETTDIHHEGIARDEHLLCPNCHALITRGLKTMEELVQPNETIPLYNPAIHKAGDRVLVKPGKKLIEITIPKLDADGNIMPEY